MSGVQLKLAEAIEKNVRPASFPIAVSPAAEGERVGQKARRPAEDLGHRIAVCQGLNVSRTFGWTLVFGREDHACPLACVAVGHLDPGEFLDGKVADLYQDDPKVMRAMEEGYPRLGLGQVHEIWLSPLNRCRYEADLAIVYGNPAQMLVLIHAANYGHGPGVHSSSTGRFGCADWIAGAVRTGECAYLMPCSGERVFAGTQDHEMSFLIPRPRFESMTEGLEIMRAKGTYRYLVPKLGLLGEPKLPEKYLDLDPERRNKT